MAQIQTSNEGSTSHRRISPPSPLPPRGRKIQKVPELLLKEEQNSQDYIPKVVSIGPYHHGKPELRLAESVKLMTLKMVVSENEDFYYLTIKSEINNIRDCYEQQSTDKYSDDELVRMMLLDACFIIIYIETSMLPLRESDERRIRQNASSLFQTLGMLTMSVVQRDMFLLENQIPFWILKFVLSSRYKKDESQELLDSYLTRSLFREFRPKSSSTKNEVEPEFRHKSSSTENVVEPEFRHKSSLTENEEDNKEELHLLEAFHRIVVYDFCCSRAKEKASTPDPRISANRNSDPESGEPSRPISRFRSRMNELKARPCRRIIKNRNEGDRAKEDLKKFVQSFRSATYLKAKGIHFRPSPTKSLKDIKFTSNWIYGKLQLPQWFVSTHTKVFFLNMTAYELSPENPTEGVVTTYINLMKSLIVNPEDVEELQEKKILFCTLGSDEQILKVYQDINTYGADNPQLFQEVKDKIQAYQSGKAKIWVAELIHAYFGNPWTFITFLAATAFSVLTFLPSIFSIRF